MDKVLFDRTPVTGLTKWFKIVNVSLVIVKVLIACGVAVLLLQLLCAHHGRADGSVPGPVELPQVNLEANQRVISRLYYHMIIYYYNAYNSCCKMWHACLHYHNSRTEIPSYLNVEVDFSAPAEIREIPSSFQMSSPSVGI